MPGTPAGINALVKQLRQLRQFIEANPQDASARQAYDALDKKFEQMKADKKAGERAAKASKPKPALQESTASRTPGPTKREKAAIKLEERYKQSQQSVQQARAILQSLLERRDAVPQGHNFSNDSSRITKDFDLATERLNAEVANSDQLLSRLNKQKASVELAHSRQEQRRNIADDDDIDWTAVIEEADVITSGHQVVVPTQVDPDQSVNDEDFGSDIDMSALETTEIPDDNGHQTPTQLEAGQQYDANARVQPEAAEELGSQTNADQQPEAEDEFGDVVFDDSIPGWYDTILPLGKDLGPAIQSSEYLQDTGSIIGNLDAEPEVETYLANLEGDVVCASIAALTAGIAQEGVNVGIMPSNLQMWARIDNTHGFACVTRPNKMVIPPEGSLPYHYLGLVVDPVVGPSCLQRARLRYHQQKHCQPLPYPSAPLHSDRILQCRYLPCPD